VSALWCAYVSEEVTEVDGMVAAEDDDDEDAEDDDEDAEDDDEDADVLGGVKDEELVEESSRGLLEVGLRLPC